MVSGKLETPFFDVCDRNEKSNVKYGIAQNETYTVAKRTFQKDGKYYSGIVPRATPSHYFIIQARKKRKATEKGETEKKGATEIAPFAVATKTRRFPLLVEVTGLEPTTSWSRTKRATKLRYTS